MANVGVRYARWAKQTAEPDNALPQYGDVRSLGALVSVQDTPNYNDVKQYGDDRAVNVLADIRDCDLDCEVTELEIEIAAELYGETFESGDPTGVKTSSANDNPPYGGFGFIRATYADDAYGYIGVYYPKVKAVPQGMSFQTKGETIAFVGDKFRFKAVACKSGVWKMESEPFATDDAAKSWVDDLVKKYVAPNS